ncbi:MAG TPA: cytochrome c biogenesis protein ResB [Candidatus Saccharimonadales bacterium]|nr:cytochrome c biogenesis protein ResB [Candidatus Saccharimonadales bacterium]
MLLERLIKFLTSLRLTVVLLVLSIVLIFAGTFGEVHLGLYQAQTDYFRSFFVYWQPSGAHWKIPVFPGGYFLGMALLINLIAAHLSRFKFTRKKIGLWIIHAGLILLILGQLATDLFAKESQMHLREGQTKNYSQSDRMDELAITDITDKKLETVVAIPQSLLARESDIRNGHLPFIVRVKQFYANSVLSTNATPDFARVAADAGVGADSLWWKRVPRETDMNRRDTPSALVQIVTPDGPVGIWLVSDWLEQPQTFTANDRTYQMQLRPERFYLPFSLKLLKFTHTVYQGTDTPRSFSSQMMLMDPGSGEHRQVLIYMNHPLRYDGRTFYQASYDTDNQGTILQVVKNPSWLTPYLACVIIATGLIIQFLSHLVPFLKKRRAA